MFQLPNQQLKEHLVRDGLVTSEEFDSIADSAKRMGQDIAQILISRNIISKEYFHDLAAKFLGVERVDLAKRAIDENILKLLPENLSRQKRSIIFAQEADGAIDAAMEDPGDLETIEFLSRYLKAKIKPFLATEDDLNAGFSFYGRRLAEDFKKIIEENIRATLRFRAGSAEKAAIEVPIVAIVDNLLAYAISLRASDIHLEILEDIILIRYRIDGILHEIIRIPKEVHPAIVARIKFLSGLKLDEHFKPQDGRFRYKAGVDFVDIRVSIMPTFYGEKIETRLLSATQKPLSFEELGIMDDMAAIIKENIAKTYGLILVCGPTGSGKTTTMYSVLNILNKPEVNIVTVEDPVEYDMRYVNQTQINPLAGITFASGLRAILRQDPNVIMIGEIRDEETAEISVHSALTGHLVLSSLHTNDAPTAVPRLIDMKMPPFLVAAVLNMVLAQRLLRRICLNCIESFDPEPVFIEQIKRQFKELGLELAFKPPKTLYRGKGCPACGFTGYKGRMGIFEVMDITEEIRRLIAAPDFTLDQLRNLAKKEGILTMFEDGLRKAERGLTTIEEVFRVIRE